MICFSGCKTCAIVGGLLKASYLLTYLLTYLHRDIPRHTRVWLYTTICVRDRFLKKNSGNAECGARIEAPKAVSRVVERGEGLSHSPPRERSGESSPQKFFRFWILK